MSPVHSHNRSEAFGAALALVGQYGEDAEVIATLRAAELAALNDSEGLAYWDDVIACIQAIGVAPSSGQALN
jgi:hypothetical protein